MNDIVITGSDKESIDHLKQYLAQ